MARRKNVVSDEDSPVVELSRDEKIALIQRAAEKECKRLNNANVPAFVNFGQPEADKPEVDEFGFTTEGLGNLVANDSNGTDE